MNPLTPHDHGDAVSALLSAAHIDHTAGDILLWTIHTARKAPCPADQSEDDQGTGGQTLHQTIQQSALMKIILSRKGFDQSDGGIPSPIFPDGTLLSLPVQDDWGPVRYDQIRVQAEGRDLTAGKVLSDLSEGTRETYRGNEGVHLDPDLRASALRRCAGWRPLFGPGSKVQGHLDENGVKKGDLFLFFGWFRQIEWSHGKLSYKPNARDLHVIFGWLKVGEVWPVGQGNVALPAWAQYHPHAAYNYGPSNTIYAAVDGLGGGGAFPSFLNQLQLTAPDASTRSVWRLPLWFYRDNRPQLTCHPQRQLANGRMRWEARDDHVRLTSVGRGQEFVLDTDYYPEARLWAEDILTNGHPQAQTERPLNSKKRR